MPVGHSSQKSEGTAWKWAMLGAIGVGSLYQGYEQFVAKEGYPQPAVESYPYVLIGCGPAVLSAAAKIRETDPEGEILIIGEYRSVPYTRKALTTLLLGKDDEIETIDRQPEEWFEETKIKYYPGVAVWNVDPQSKMVHIEGNRVITFGKCLIASGSKPTMPEYGIADGAPVSTFHKLDQVEHLRKVLEEGNKTIAIIGESSWACTLASVITSKYENITVEQIIPGSGILPDILPPYLSEYAANKQDARKKISVIKNAEVMAIDAVGEKGVVELESGAKIQADHVVIVPDFVPNTGFVGPIEVDNTGVIVNTELLSSSDVYAAGEASSHYNPGYGRRTLFGENNELLSGQIAGLNMASEKNIPYNTDIVEEYKVAGTKFNVIGRCDSSLKTHSIWLRPLENWEDEDYTSDDYKRGIVYYLLPNNRIVGVLLWNMPDEDSAKEDRAITVIQGRRTFPDDTARSAIVVTDKEALAP